MKDQEHLRVTQRESAFRSKLFLFGSRSNWFRENHLSFLHSPSLFLSLLSSANSEKGRYSDSSQMVPGTSASRSLLYFEKFVCSSILTSILEHLHIRKKVAQNDKKNEELSIMQRKVVLCSLPPPLPSNQFFLKITDIVSGKSNYDIQRDVCWEWAGSGGWSTDWGDRNPTSHYKLAVWP